MKDIAEALPGIERIRARFLDLLEERRTVIASAALAAWDSNDPAVASQKLQVAQATLHQIAGSAGSLGFAALGQAARDCEGDIIEFIEVQDRAATAMPASIMCRLDDFVSMCQSPRAG